MRGALANDQRCMGTMTDGSPVTASGVLSTHMLSAFETVAPVPRFEL
jgi:hypothetical protein